jgi:hypothetical protein
VATEPRPARLFVRAFFRDHARGSRWLVLLFGAATTVATGQASVSGETLLFSLPAKFKVGYTARHHSGNISRRHLYRVDERPRRSMLLLKCRTNPGTGKPETTAFRVIKGKGAPYSVQHPWRAVAADQEVAAAMHALATVVVCDARTPEHACRSPRRGCHPDLPGARSRRLPRHSPAPAMT